MQNLKDVAPVPGLHSETVEAEAEGKLKPIFTDIRETVGMATVGSLFRRLAIYPWYIELAWRNLKPNAGIVYFHRTAGGIRRAALESAGANPKLESATDGLAGAASSLLDQACKLLLAAGALRAGANGQLPKMHLISPEDKRFMRPEQPAPLVDHSWRPGPSQTESQSRFLETLRRYGFLQTDQDETQALLQWPEELWDAWQKVASRLPESAVEERAVDLRQRVSVAAEALPFRLEISSTACRQSGLKEYEIDAVRRITDDEWTSLARRVLYLAALSAPAASRATESKSEPEAAGA